MSRASIPTLLALDRYSEIMGINGANFNQGTSDIVFPMTNRCEDLWFQYSWQQQDSVSREELAGEIARAEEEIANYLGWWPAPVWIAQDVKMYPRHHRPDVYQVGGYNVRGQQKSVKASYAKIIEPGQRAVTLLCTAEQQGDPCSLTFSDEDLDGYPETVTIVANGITVSDVCEIKVYFAGHDGDPEWEIRPARTKTLAAGVFTATFWKWQFIDPDYWEAIPTATTPTPTVDLDDFVYVVTADIYREYNDPTATSASFYWEPEPTNIGVLCSMCGGSGCVRCTLTEQNGCMHIRDAERGYVVPVPGTYDTDNSQWTSATWSICRDPDQVKVYYYAGNLSELNRAGRRCEPLSAQWARVIAGMATARLHRPICACGNVAGFAEHLQEDLGVSTRETGRTVPFSLLENPFGTKRGEVEAWQYVSRLTRNRHAGVGAV